MAAAPYFEDYVRVVAFSLSAVGLHFGGHILKANLVYLYQSVARAIKVHDHVDLTPARMTAKALMRPRPIRPDIPALKPVNVNAAAAIKASIDTKAGGSLS